jgi:hypothetical protein
LVNFCKRYKRNQKTEKKKKKRNKNSKRAQGTILAQSRKRPEAQPDLPEGV